jgi:hypothetical protein
MIVHSNYKLLCITSWILFLSNATTAQADFGPKLIEMIRVEVQLDGNPVSDQATGVLLAPRSEGGVEPANAAKDAPKLTIPYTDENGRKWIYAEYLWGGEFENGVVTFKGFHLSRHGMPSVVRLAVYRPETETVYITNTAEPGEHICLMAAKLSADGTGSLTDLSVPLWRRIDFWKALLITMAAECLIAGWVRSRQKPNREPPQDNPRFRLVKLIILCLLVNLFTLPLVWFFGGHFLFTLGRNWGIAVFLGLEFAAFLVEGTAYWRSGLLNTGRAFQVALLANGVSFGLGFFL